MTRRWYGNLPYHRSLGTPDGAAPSGPTFNFTEVLLREFDANVAELAFQLAEQYDRPLSSYNED